MKYISDKDIAKAGLLIELNNAGEEGLSRTSLTQYALSDPFRNSKQVTVTALDELLRDGIVKDIRTRFDHRPAIVIADETAARAIRDEVTGFVTNKESVANQQQLTIMIGALTALTREEALTSIQIQQAMHGKYHQKVIHPARPGGSMYTNVDQILEEMAKRNLLTVVKGRGRGPRYTITDEGRQALREYAQNPDTQPIYEIFSAPMVITLGGIRKHVLGSGSMQDETEPQPLPESETARPYMSAFEAAKHFKDTGAEVNPRDLHSILLAMEKEGSTDVRRVPTQSTQSGATTVLIKRSALAELERRYAEQQTARVRR